ncbi:MAG: hypothetical protein KA109_10715 [Saprospiraceae bacterium]|jgi:opacity protein-like surface antigen|nr:hypothetical protein [Saprospiraceae bacterium]MBK6816774.1 hypothetical protein [Saprospiraceae bacterium]MBK7371302.1 hypothetical protein [Saprospiraceae bacterium]MBK7436204.1 hypothetical protein [Saprospiraceae bacterium]MBK8281364.1 hypothetical protein [Saprospiraceae bacterium]
MAKIFYLFLFVLIFDNLLSAQTEKGTWLLGGNAAYQRSHGSGTLNINPSIGYFLLNNFAAGAQLNFLGIKGGSFVSVGFFGKYYFLGDERGRFYATGGLNVGGGSGSKFDTGFTLGAGYAHFLNESISIDIGTLYNKVGANNSIFSIGAGFQIHFSSLHGSRLD